LFLVVDCTAPVKFGQVVSRFWPSLPRAIRPELKRAIGALRQRWQATAILIEDRASGTQLIQELVKAGLAVKAIAPVGDKVMRMSAQTATIENGFVYLPKQAPWLAEYLHELTTFDKGKHDDQVDSTSQALKWIKESQSATKFSWDCGFNVPYDQFPHFLKF
jgi:predicted phage terminase large subunit-like protein